MKMLATRMVWALVVCCAVATAARASEEPVLVGDYGDVRHIKVLGAATFNTAAIQNALFGDSDVLAALHPKAPLEKLEALLCEKVRQGYFRGGFPSVKVECQRLIIFNELIINIEEGPRFFCGDIHVTGANNIPVAELKRAIGSPCPELQAASLQIFDRGGWSEVKWLDGDGDELEATPPWSAGDIARIDEMHLRNLRRWIGVAFQSLGFYFVKFDAGLTYDLAAARVELKIIIEDEGPRALQGTIEISGNKRHSREQILTFLKLNKQSDIVQQDCLRLEHELLRSGRFTQSRVTMVRPATPTDSKVLKIELEEHPRVSLLSDSLSREEQVFLRFHDWLAGFGRRGDDLAIESREPSFPGELIVSPRNGLLLSMRNWNEPGGPIVWSVLAGNREVGFYSLTDLRRFVMPWKGTLKITTSMAFTKPIDEPRPRTFSFHVNWERLRKNQTDPGSELATRLSPVLFLDLAHEKDAKLTWSGDVLSSVGKSSLARVHGPTGALLEWTEFDDQGRVLYRAAFAPGLMAAQLETIESSLKTKTNECVVHQPVTSAMRFFSAERLLWHALRDDTPDLQTVLVVRKLLDRVVLAPLDNAASVATENEPASNLFSIPTDPATKTGAESDWDWVFPAIGQTWLKVNDVIVPRESWLATILRCETLVFIHHSERFKSDYTSLYVGTQTGPAGNLAVSYLLGLKGRTGRPLFAEKGLKLLSAEEFRKDYQPLLSTDHLLGQCLIRMAAGIQELTSEEAKVFDDSLLQPAVQWLRQEKDRPLETVLPEALDKMWEQGLRTQVEALLREQARPQKTE